MQFVRGGPDIPERLLYAHEQGRVVFFCGAGISKPAGLPLFEELVRELHRTVFKGASGAKKAARVMECIEEGELDKATSLLERELRGGRSALMEVTRKLLIPKEITAATYITHEALLRLGQSQGVLRLVTTNLDRLFEEARERLPPEELADYELYGKATAPPDSGGDWNGLAYLHGLLPAKPIKPGSLSKGQLVLSSGDIGTAYHGSPRIQSFLNELLRSYTVCFVGYSMEADAPIRSMLAALARGRREEQSQLPEIFAFCPYGKEGAGVAAQSLEDSEITPIPYSDADKHTALHKTLVEWADVYSLGREGKQRLVSECAKEGLSDEGEREFVVGRMLWALSDPSGGPARHFANLNPVPPLDWLEHLSAARYGVADLERFGIPRGEGYAKDLQFSLLGRPAPGHLSPSMSVVGSSPWERGEVKLDEVVGALSRWMMRHLDNPELLSFFARKGGRLHSEVERLLRDHLEYSAQHEAEAVASVSLKTSHAAPPAIMRALWEMLLGGLFERFNAPPFALVHWGDDLKRTGLTIALRQRIRELLAPRVRLIGYRHDSPRGASSIFDFFRCNVSLAAGDPYYFLEHMDEAPAWREALPILFDDFDHLLREAFHLMGELGLAIPGLDLSWAEKPAVEMGFSDSHESDWLILIDLTREAWSALAQQDPERAREKAESWLSVPYPLFRRMAFFAAARGDVVPAEQGLDWLLTENCRWLCTLSTMHEAVSLIASLGPRLNELALRRLEDALLASRPASKETKGVGEKEHAVWLRLTKLKESIGGELGSAAEECLAALDQEYPAWQRDPRSRDTVAFSEDEEGGYVEDPPADEAKSQEQLVAWLREKPTWNLYEPDDWKDRCLKDFATCIGALRELAQEGEWPVSRWEVALVVWAGEEELRGASWQQAAPTIAGASDETLLALTEERALTQWLQDTATADHHSDHFFQIVHRILELGRGDEAWSEGEGTISVAGGEAAEIDDPLALAINNPVGHITGALIQRYFKLAKAAEAGGDVSQILEIFTSLCDRSIGKFRHGRVLLVHSLVNLIGLEPDWTRRFLLPLLDWETSPVEAPGAWAGLLKRARFSRPMLEALKRPFLDTINHYPKLGFHGGIGYHAYQNRYASMLAVVAMDAGDVIPPSELAEAVAQLPSRGLASVAKTLYNRLRKAKDPGTVWDDQIEPCLDHIWPMAGESSELVGVYLGLLCISAGKRFPEALERLEDWLEPRDEPRDLVHEFNMSSLGQDFPEESLRFLDKIVGRDAGWARYDLADCLNKIIAAKPALNRTASYRRLHGLV